MTAKEINEALVSYGVTLVDHLDKPTTMYYAGVRSEYPEMTASIIAQHYRCYRYAKPVETVAYDEEQNIESFSIEVDES